VQALTLEELRTVFAGEVSSWAALGGPERAITVVIRPPSSGTHRFFADHVLAGGSYSPAAVTVARTADVVAAVADDPDAIGYGGVAYGPELIHCSIDGVAPLADGDDGARYPLARYLSFYTAEPPTGLVAGFLDWCVGPEGQRVVADVGYLPLWERG
jgi:phosphate transport system substrate-binding protein